MTSRIDPLHSPYPAPVALVIESLGDSTRAVVVVGIHGAGHGVVGDTVRPSMVSWTRIVTGA
jgi:hypothetical protein